MFFKGVRARNTRHMFNQMKRDRLKTTHFFFDMSRGRMLLHIFVFSFNLIQSPVLFYILIDINARRRVKQNANLRYTSLTNRSGLCSFVHHW